MILSSTRGVILEKAFGYNEEVISTRNVKNIIEALEWLYQQKEGKYKFLLVSPMIFWYLNRIDSKLCKITRFIAITIQNRFRYTINNKRTVAGFCLCAFRAMLSLCEYFNIHQHDFNLILNFKLGLS